MGKVKKYRDWLDKRFDGPRPKAVEKTCVQCGRLMWLPPSKAGIFRACSPACVAARIAAGKEKRKRDCETCGKIFWPRTCSINKGCGRFCSQACNTAGRAALASPETQATAQQRRRELRALGLSGNPTGEQNSRWKGGPQACRERRRDSGKEAAEQRAYAAANPERRRAWTRENHARRREQKGGRLPNGTVNKIGEKQRWRCAVCKCRIRKLYHIDHIQPLARGGRHQPRNIQLLCPACNLRKGAKDPIDFMRLGGRLL